MGETNIIIFKYHGFLLAFITNMLFLNCARSAFYTVADEQGWDTDANFDTWSRKYNFSVGDVLVFNYLKGQHNVYDVTEATYRSCNASTGVLAKYESGHDEIRLTKAKKYWFICNVPGHCLGGMKFGVNVQEDNSTNVATTPQVEPTPPSNSAANYAFERWKLCSYLITFGILLKLYC